MACASDWILSIHQPFSSLVKELLLYICAQIDTVNGTQQRQRVHHLKTTCPLTAVMQWKSFWHIASDVIHSLLVFRQHSWHCDSSLRVSAAATGFLCSSCCGGRQRLPGPEQHSHPYHPSMFLWSGRLSAYLLSWGHLPACGPQHWSPDGYSALCSFADW